METIQTSFDHLLRENPMGEGKKADFCKIIGIVRKKVRFLTV